MAVIPVKTDIEKRRLLLESVYPENNRFQIRKYTDFLRAGEIDVSPESLLKYVDYLDTEYEEGRYAASTHSTYLSAACTALTNVMDNLNLTDNERVMFERVKRTVNKRKKKTNSKAIDPDAIPSIEELKQLVEDCRDMTISLIVEFLMNTGARISETLNIRLSDIVYKRSYGEITLRGKRSKERTVKLDKSLLRAIQAHFNGITWLFEHSGKQYSRISVTNRIKIEGLRHLGRDISAHTIRHSFLSHALKKTGRIKAVQELAGHSSAATTLDKYVHDRFTWEEQQDLLK
jgi:integrase